MEPLRAALAVRKRADSLHGGGEQSRPDAFHDLGFEVLLRALLGQCGPVRIDHDALEDLAAVLLEQRDLGGEIFAGLVVLTGVDERVAGVRPAGASLAV